MYDEFIKKSWCHWYKRIYYKTDFDVKTSDNWSKYFTISDYDKTSEQYTWCEGKKK